MNQTHGSTRLLSVTSGKGGVGKTNVAANLAVCLCQFERRVLLVDADMGTANVDVLLGMSPESDLGHVLRGEKTLGEVVIDGPRGVLVLPGASGLQEVANPEPEALERFLHDLDEYCEQVDYVVVDTSPGIAAHVTDCLLVADEVLLVTNPEPTALTDAYALLKVLKARKNGELGRISVIMNRVHGKEEAMRCYDRLRGAAQRFLGWDVGYLGSVAWDESVEAASNRQVDFVTHYANSPCSLDVRKLAARLLSSAGNGGPGAGRFFRTMVEGASDE